MRLRKAGSSAARWLIMGLILAGVPGCATGAHKSGPAFPPETSSPFSSPEASLGATGPTGGLSGFASARVGSGSIQGQTSGRETGRPGLSSGGVTREGFTRRQSPASPGQSRDLTTRRQTPARLFPDGEGREESLRTRRNPDASNPGRPPPGREVIPVPGPVHDPRIPRGGLLI